MGGNYNEVSRFEAIALRRFDDPALGFEDDLLVLGGTMRILGGAR
jgi:hypothetical protein